MAHQGVKKVHAELKPPRDAIPAGVTPSGKQLYRRTRQRAVIVDRKDSVTGEQQYRKNTLTGEEIFKLRTVKEVIDVEEVFYLESEGNANVRMIPYAPPSAAEERDNQRRQEIAAFQDRFQEALAETALAEGLSPEELIARMRTAGGPAPEGYTTEDRGGGWQGLKDPEGDEVPGPSGGSFRGQEAARAGAHAHAHSRGKLPDGYKMDHHGGGWYSLTDSDGSEVPGPTTDRWQGKEATIEGAWAHAERKDQPLPEPGPDQEEAEERKRQKDAEEQVEVERQQDDAEELAEEKAAEDEEADEEALREAEKQAREEARAQSEMTPDI